MLTKEQMVQAHYARHLLNSINVDTKPAVVQKLESLLNPNQVAIASNYAKNTSEQIAAKRNKETYNPADQTGSFEYIYLSELYDTLDERSLIEYVSFLESHVSQETQDKFKQEAEETCNASVSLILERLKQAWS